MDVTAKYLSDIDGLQLLLRLIEDPSLRYRRQIDA